MRLGTVVEDTKEYTRAYYEFEIRDKKGVLIKPGQFIDKNTKYNRERRKPKVKEEKK